MLTLTSHVTYHRKFTTIFVAGIAFSHRICAAEKIDVDSRDEARARQPFETAVHQKVPDCRAVGAPTNGRVQRWWVTTAPRMELPIGVTLISNRSLNNPIL